MRLLVTGASGFVGRRLMRAARDRWPRAEVIGLAGPHETGGVDVANAADVRAAVAAAHPTHMAHLAALAAVKDATLAPREAFRVNLGGALNVVEALRSEAPDAFLLHVSSAEVYGGSLLQSPGAVNEETRLQPLNAYAASKAAADLMVQAAIAQGLGAVVARPFNHIGAGQSEAFVAPAFAAQIARAEAGLQSPVISVGRLEDGRDFLPVEDVVNAYLLLLEHGRGLGYDVFNIASGDCVPISDVLKRLQAKSELPLSIQIDPSRLRREPSACYRGDATRLRMATGWQPLGDLDHALAEVLAEQRSRLAGVA